MAVYRPKHSPSLSVVLHCYRISNLISSRQSNLKHSNFNGEKFRFRFKTISIILWIFDILEVKEFIFSCSIPILDYQCVWSSQAILSANYVFLCCKDTLIYILNRVVNFLCCKDTLFYTLTGLSTFCFVKIHFFYILTRLSTKSNN